MTTTSLPGGTHPLGDLTVTRMGYGAMQLAGPNSWGEPHDRAEALTVLRALPELGVTHLDTADFYGPHVTNNLIREALHPYDGITVATKVGAVRDDAGQWILRREPELLQQQVHDNLARLGLERLDVVNLRLGNLATPAPGSIAPQVEALAQLQAEGKIRHIGLSMVTAEQVAEAQSIVPVVAVQNFYNLAVRADDALIDPLAEQGIPYVPFSPLSYYSPEQTQKLDAVARRLGERPSTVALAWLLQRSPNILLIPGTSKLAHLRENIFAASLSLDAETIAELNAIGGTV